MRRMLQCLLAALWIMMVLMLPAAQADDGTAWMNEPCEVSGNHNFQTEVVQEWDCTHDGIWIESCADCGKSHTYTDPAPGHQWDDGKVTKEPTCTEPGERTYTCIRDIPGRNVWDGATYTETIPAGHDWDGGVVTAAATCTADGVKTYTCSRCGMTKTETIPATGHTAVSVPAVAATCTSAGKTYGSACSVCGEVLTAQQEQPALGHNWDGGVYTGPTCTKDGSRVLTCIRCGETQTETFPATGHAWDSGTVITPSTCTTDGVQVFTCYNCGETRTESFTKTGHNPVPIPATAATCTTAGKTEGKLCTFCGAVLDEQEDIPALGHDYQLTDSKDATDTEDGYKTYTCSRCGDSYTETISKAPHEHTYAMTAETPATCTAAGSRTYRCTICGATYSDTIPATGHNWGGWVTVKNPTATEDGLMERVCGNDASHKEQQPIPATGETETTGSLIVTKIAGDTQQPLAGAHFRVDGPDVMDEWISTTEPHTVGGLTVNEVYTLFEVSAPKGYKTADSITFKITDNNPLSLTVVDEKADESPTDLPALHLVKVIDCKPDNGSYFQEGESVSWSITVTNTSDKPVKSITVTDGGVTVGTFAEIAPGETVTCSVPAHVVTEYEAEVAGVITNIGTATGMDENACPSDYVTNPVSVPTSPWSPVPLPGTKKPDESTTPGGGFDPGELPIVPPWLSPVPGPDGTPITGLDGMPVYAPVGTVPVIGPDGRPLLTPEGWPVLMLPDGVCVAVTPAGLILWGKDDNPIPDPNGTPICISFDDTTLCCSLRLDAMGDNTMNHTLHVCSSHILPTMNALAAGPAEAVAIWEEEIGRMYDALYKAGNDLGKAAVEKDRAAFDLYTTGYRALYGDAKTAEMLRLRCTELCCMIHTAPEELPDSLLGNYAVNMGNAVYDVCERVFGDMNGTECEMDIHLNATLGSALQKTRAAVSGNSADPFTAALAYWQMALDSRMSETYRTADRDVRTAIAAWRQGLEQMYAARQELLLRLYPDNNMTVRERLMNLYRDACVEVYTGE